uniref:Uncharacterized protein n=1 Tax=Anopheles maculatus TaxID=74869 RepID=A0A182S921_9DIPT
MNPTARSLKKAPPSSTARLTETTGQSGSVRITRSAAAKEKPGPSKGPPSGSVSPLRLSALEGLLPSDDDDSDYDYENDSYERLAEDYDILAEELDAKEEAWRKEREALLDEIGKLRKQLAISSPKRKTATTSAVKEAFTQTSVEFGVNADAVAESAADIVAPEVTVPASAVELWSTVVAPSQADRAASSRRSGSSC